MGVRDSDDEGEMGTSGGTTTHVHPFNTTNNKHGPSYGADGDRPPNAMGEDHWHDGTTDNGPMGDKDVPAVQSVGFWRSFGGER